MQNYSGFTLNLIESVSDNYLNVSCLYFRVSLFTTVYRKQQLSNIIK